MNENTVKAILKGAIAVVGFKLVSEWLEEEKRGYTAEDEIDVVDAYYEGRLFGKGPTQAEVADRFEISQAEVSKTIKTARSDVWENWSWKRATKRQYEGEVERVAEATGLRVETVAAIVRRREGQGKMKVRRRYRADARQGKLL